MELTLKPFSDVEKVEKPFRPSRRNRKMAAEIVQLLSVIDDYKSPDVPLEQYLDTRAGQYITMMEEIANVAAKSGMWDMARATLVDLLRMTKIGRAKADISVDSKLRDETPLKHLTEEQLNAIVRPASASE